MIKTSLTWAVALGGNSRSDGQDYADSLNVTECDSLSRTAGHGLLGIILGSG
jgi:hypothetical protein